MVISQPVRPGVSAKSAPIGVRRPIGRISVVTIAKIPSVTATTPNHRTVGVRVSRTVIVSSELVAVTPDSRFRDSAVIIEQAVAFPRVEGHHGPLRVERLLLDRARGE